MKTSIVEQIYKSINAVSNKVNEMSKRLDNFFGIKCDENAEQITLSEIALCDMSEDIESKMNEIEVALCDLSEEESEVI